VGFHTAKNCGMPHSEKTVEGHTVKNCGCHRVKNCGMPHSESFGMPHSEKLWVPHSARLWDSTLRKTVECHTVKKLWKATQ